MSLLEITLTEKMIVSALQQHICVTKRVDLFHREGGQFKGRDYVGGRWVKSCGYIFSNLPSGIDDNDEEAMRLLYKARRIIADEVNDG